MSMLVGLRSMGVSAQSVTSSPSGTAKRSSGMLDGAGGSLGGCTCGGGPPWGGPGGGPAGGCCGAGACWAPTAVSASAKRIDAVRRTEFDWGIGR